MSAAAHASRSARASQASSRGPSGVAIGPSNSNLAFGLEADLDRRERRAVAVHRRGRRRGRAAPRGPSPRRPGSRAAALLPTHAAWRADGSRHVVVRPGDPELVADAVEHAAHERVVAGPGTRRVGRSRRPGPRSSAVSTIGSTAGWRSRRSSGPVLGREDDVPSGRTARTRSRPSRGCRRAACRAPACAGSRRAWTPGPRP